MSDEEQIRDETEEIVNDEPAEEAVTEAVIEEVKPAVKAKSKAKAKQKIKITKEPVEPTKEETIKEPEPIIEVEKKYIYIYIYLNKQMVDCPDCNLTMTKHTL